MIVSRIVERAVESERVSAVTHRFAVEAPPGLPLVAGEDVYAAQVLRNYLSNAAKYSPAGSTVRISVRAEDGGVAVRVIDEGAGLPAGPTEPLFDVFHRATEAIGQKPGAGIGLFVCRELIRAMGGRIWARQAPPEIASGAEFGFWLPASAEDDGSDAD